MGDMGPVSGQAVTLANSIIGVGILAMPFCFKQCGIVLSIIILITSGLMSRLASHFLLKSAIMSRRRNFEALAFHVFGSTGKFAVEIGIIGFLMGTCIAYFVVVGDLGPQIIAKMFNFNQSDSLRTGVMVIVSLVCVIPLGLLRNVDSLSNVCAATIGFYFCLVVKIIAEATSQMFSGDWIEKVVYWQPAGVLQCLPIFSMALFCQTQLFEIYDTLPNASLEKMNSVTKNAVYICSVVYVLVGLFGYIAFCNQPISGNILVSFSPTMASDAIKMGFVMSLAFSFPLIIFPCRASLYSLLYRKGYVSPHEILNNSIPETRFRCLTVIIVIISLLIGLMLPNIELVLGLVGSTIGVMICVIFPATCFICMSIKNTNERILAQIVLCFGIIIMVLGTYANLQAVEIDNVGLENRLALKSDIEHNAFIESKVVKAVSNLPVAGEIKEDLNLINNILKSNGELSDIQIKKPENIMSTIVKESKMQPPNPLPPARPNIVEEKTMNQIGKEQNEGAGDSEIKFEVTISNLPVIVNSNRNGESKNVKIINTVNIEEVKAKTLDAKIRNEKKLDNFKEQSLRDTIKRHEEEQIQMVNEQKQILNEIKKTAIEIDRDNVHKKIDDTINKNNLENKKLAVESIQKLAKLAIESLGVGLESANVVPEIQKIPDKATNVTNTPNNHKKIFFNVHDISSKKVVVADYSSIKQEELPIKNVDKEHIHTNNEAEFSKNGKKSALLEQQKNLEETVIKPDYITIPHAKIKKNKAQETLKKNVLSSEKISHNDVIKHDDYVGGKRDILQINTYKSNNTSGKSGHNITTKRTKRDIKNCEGAEMVENLGIICNEELETNSKLSKNADNFLKMSYVLSNPKSELQQNQLLKTNVLHLTDAIQYHSRNLQSLNPKEKS